MKSKTIALFLFLNTVCFSQIPTVGKLFKTPEKIKILGSPYNEKMFSQAIVATIEQKPFMRYNIFYDEFEFISAKKDTLILDKTEYFGEIVFTNTKKKFKLTTYTNLKNKLFYGYLIDLYSKNEVILYKKDNISFTEEKLAKTSLERDMPAKSAMNSPVYFLKFKDKMATEFPENKKGLIKLFSDKKEIIEIFFKENKLNFSDENDLKKIIDLISGI
jgi:hypothetical protein